jgi:hypothetical protein
MIRLVEGGHVVEPEAVFARRDWAVRSLIVRVGIIRVGGAKLFIASQWGRALATASPLRRTI